MDRSQATRALLQEVALDMFTERGYDNVTIEEVAHRAGVSHMTFYRHFPTKESVVLEDPYDPMIGAAVAAQDAGSTAIERTRRAFVSVLAEMSEEDDEAILRRVRLAVDNRTLRARVWENNQATEKVIVDGLVKTGTSPAEAWAAAGAVLGVVTAALLNWAGEGAPTSLRVCLTNALEILKPSERAATS